MKVGTGLFVIISGLYLIVSGIHCYKVVENTLKYAFFKNEAADVLNFESRLLLGEEWKNDNNKTAQVQQTSEKRLRFANDGIVSSVYYSWYFVIETLIYGLAIVILYKKNLHFYKFLSIATIFSAILCLYVGVLSPMLEISAFKNNLVVDLGITSMVFKGDMYFYHQCKSILDIIVLLMNHHNFIVAISILVFSIVVPFIKLSVNGLVIFKSALYQKPFIYFIINKIAKWSMTDVFVAAVFLSFLSFQNLNTGITTESTILPGLFFFLGYCVLSLISAHLTAKHIQISRLTLKNRVSEQVVAGHIQKPKNPIMHAPPS
jgi:hypothetical protein